MVENDSFIRNYQIRYKSMNRVDLWCQKLCSGSDISLMNQQQSAISLRRQTFHKQIRNRELSEYFSKRRHELIHSSPSNLSDDYKIEQILRSINNFCIQKLKQIIIQLIKIDPSHAVFYELTGFNPETPPAIFKSIMQGVLRENEETLVWEELGMEYEFSVQERNELFGVYKELESELERRSKQFIDITNLIKTIQDMNLLCKQEIVIFLSFMLNLHHILRKLKEILNIQQKSNKLVGRQSPINYQAETSLVLLQNLLTADDRLLQPILPQFIELNGCNPDNLGLYYNLFLIKCSDKAVRCKIFNYFIRLLEKNRQFFLQQHRVVVATINAAIQQSDDLRAKPDEYNFQILQERLIKLLGELLKLLNMRYQSSITPFIESKAEDYIFVCNLMKVFHIFSGQTQLIRVMMEDRSICIFLLNRLVYSETEKQAQIFQFCLNILSHAVRDHYSLHYFINEEPRFMIKIMSIFDKYLKPNFIKLQQYQQLTNLQYLIYVINDLSSNPRGVQILIQKSIHFKIMKIYYSIPGQTKTQRQIKHNCEMIYLNMLSALRTHPNSPSLFFHHLFTNSYVNSATNQVTNGCYFMLMNLLKYSSNRHKNLQLKTALIIVNFISEACFQCKEYEVAREMLLSQTITAQLLQLRNCPDEKIVNLAQRAIGGIQDLRKVKSYNGNAHCYEQQQI